MPKRLLYSFILFLPSFSFLSAQVYFEADPFRLLHYEKDYYLKARSLESLLFRPSFQLVNGTQNNRWSLTARAEYFENSTAPNLENSSVKWIGKGISRCRSLRLSYAGGYLSFVIEPYHFDNENLDYTVPVRKGIYKRMNDNRPHEKSPLVLSGVREFQLLFHFRGLGVGVSNANMWWGPGLHSSLQMSTNTSGFRYFTFGTVHEKRLKNIGFDIKYIFSPLDDRNVGEPYFTALLASSTFYSNPQFTFGFSRS